jgi:ubiquinone/menaquinone biosynthesis C-methylase UbiE
MSERRDWDDAYSGDSAPPWDIGRPQPAFAALAAQGRFAGAVVDVGCGTGEHTLLAASYGADALGVDVSRSAIEQARGKAQERNLDARFEVGDALALDVPDAAADAVLDSGVFHVFDDPARARYLETLQRITKPGGWLYLMCFSDRQPGDWGPRRVTRGELEESFDDGWSLDLLAPATFEINPLPAADVVEAWLLHARRNQPHHQSVGRLPSI